MLTALEVGKQYLNLLTLHYTYLPIVVDGIVPHILQLTLIFTMRKYRIHMNRRKTQCVVWWDD